ncbi:hypothetical protein [Actinopolyspora halophila]|uniref:hypothetical protein n=1 Tax=Actinopolyspora halophila TaxID=1850 RepID=UPI0004758243|nr:hypothetical protein [Actinopolyspora halophila]
MRARLDQTRTGDRVILVSSTGKQTSHPVTERRPLDDGRIRLVTPAGTLVGPRDLAVTINRPEGTK